MISGRIAIVASTAENCSTGIGKAILDKKEFTEVHGDYPYDVYRRGEDLFFFDSVPLADDTELHWEEFFDVDLFVIVYRHSGRAGKNRLTVHPMGNFSATPLAGEGRTLGAVSPQWQRHFYKVLNEVAEGSGYLVNFEVTHHGPTQLDTPVFFVEIGDGEENWGDELAHKLMAEAVHRFLDSEPEEALNCVGFGGDHYGERFERRTLSEGWAFGHMVPAREFSDVDEDILQQIVDKTVPQLDLVIWDKKKQGTLEEREFIWNFFAEKGIELKKI